MDPYSKIASYTLIYSILSGVDPGFSKGGGGGGGGANGNVWPHGYGKGEGAMEAFAMCA